MLLQREIVMNKTIYTIQGDNTVVFFDLIAAEKYLFNNYQEYITSKDQFMDYVDQMICEYEINDEVK